MALRRAGTSTVRWMRQQGQADISVLETLPKALGEQFIGPSKEVGVRYASNQALKARMKSVQNIQKITKAMKMVAASKMRTAQAVTEKCRGIVEPLVKLLGDYPAVEVANNVVIPITSDRGLCGGINSSICKYTRTQLRMVADKEEKKSALVVVGEKGRSQLQRDQAEKFAETVADVAKGKITYSLASAVAEDILKTEYDAVSIIFNRFHSAISFKPTVATVLSPETLERSVEAGGALDQYEVEGPDRAELLQDLGEFQLATMLYSALQESNCSEQASRMSAMENSTKNATEMLGKLTLTYNRSRQASITTELIEIISGAAALEG